MVTAQACWELFFLNILMEVGLATLTGAADVLSGANTALLNLGCGLAKSRGVPIVRRVALVVIIL